MVSFFLFTPKIGEDELNLTKIFQMGRNHQPDEFAVIGGDFPYLGGWHLFNNWFMSVVLWRSSSHPGSYQNHVQGNRFRFFVGDL